MFPQENEAPALDTVTQGGTVLSLTDGSGYSVDTASWMMPDSGKWYFEATVTDVKTASDAGPYIGFIHADKDSENTGAYYLYNNNGKYWNGSAWAAYGDVYLAGETIGVLINMDTGIISFENENVSQGTAYNLGDLAGEQLYVTVRSGLADLDAAC